MSVFRVKLGATAGQASVSGQGNLDVDMLTGKPVAVSLQRTIHVAGPNNIYRKLKDGQVFTDSNYWMQFTVDKNPFGFPFLEVVTDDGAPYSPLSSENTFLKTYTLSVAAGTTYSVNLCDVLGDTGGLAIFTQINNQTSGKTVKVQINGSANSIFDMAGGETEIFNLGELSVSSIAFDYTASGATGSIIMEVLVAVKAIPIS